MSIIPNFAAISMASCSDHDGHAWDSEFEGYAPLTVDIRNKSARGLSSLAFLVPRRHLLVQGLSSLSSLGSHLLDGN